MLKAIHWIYPHLGLGDHIICNAAVRLLQQKNGLVCVLAHKRYVDEIAFMYRDNPEILCRGINNGIEARKLLKDIRYTRKTYIGHTRAFRRGLSSGTCNFDKGFYKQLGFDFNMRWYGFYVLRDYDKEQEIFDKYAPKEPYAFVHDDVTRNFSIDESKITKGLKIFRPEVIRPIFSYLKLIENAQEVHCIDSSFKNMIDSTQAETKNYFLHINLLNNRCRKSPSSNRLGWYIV